jgi:signal transduction histidine kinase
MENIRPVQQKLRRPRRFFAVGVGLTLVILAAIIALGTLQLRGKIRAQIVSRDAEILHGVAQMVQVTQEADKELGGQIENLPDQFAVVLQISQLNQLNGVIVTRLFDTNGQFAAALPAHVADARVAENDWLELKRLKPISHFHPQAHLAELFVGGTTPSAGRGKVAPLLEVIIPLHSQRRPELLGVAQFLIDGQTIATQFAALDRSLALQAALAFGGGGFVIVVALGWAFRRLRRMSRQLMEGTSRLLRANEELALAAKTSAIGAITAHLVHGLSNPLSGLQEIVVSRGRDDLPETDWQDAVTTARQMQNLIGEIVRVLGEEHGLDRYEISLSELTELVVGKVRLAAQTAGVLLQTGIEAKSVLSNRDANLILLILENLLKNAIEATPAGGTVHLTIGQTENQLRFEVQDEGPGLPAELQSKLFKPCRSNKPGGHGIGLTICKQLANHLGAALELKSSSEKGSVFALQLPKTRLAENFLLDSEQRLG